MTSQKYRIGIVGATGYTGEELTRLVCRHPAVMLAYATSESSAGKRLGEIYPWLNQYGDQRLISSQEIAEKETDLVFTCLPAGETASLASDLLQKGVKVIDLGADFRFRSADVYAQWYKTKHPHPDLLQKSVYGLPEWNREQIRDAAIVGNPGCYPTSVLLALLPLMQSNLLDTGLLFIDSKSGVTGAGKTPTPTSHFCSANENLTAYKPGRVHRHVGEIETVLQQQHKGCKVIFTPHLIPMNRGLFSTLYVPLTKAIDRETVHSRFEEFYKNEPFVRVLDSIPSTNMVTHTNYCFIHVGNRYDHTIQLFSAIDNLGKGASWQAIQNMNLLLGLDEETGLQP